MWPILLLAFCMACATLVAGAWLLEWRRRQNRRDRLAASVFEACHEGIMINDAQGLIIDINPAFTRITGYSRAEALGRTPELLRSGRLPPSFYDAIEEALRREGRWTGEIWDRRKDGGFYAALQSTVAVHDEAGQLLHYVSVFSDISTLKAHQEELDRLAHYDALTGIPNRRLLTDRLAQALAMARRERQRVAVCMLDLDGFKPVNDRLGHAAGDRLLIEVATRLTSVLRSGETVARLGGDEFVLVLHHPRDESVFERVLAVVRPPVVLDGEHATVTASLGVAYFDPDQPLGGEALLHQADQALYQSKSTGRDRCTVFSEPAA